MSCDKLVFDLSQEIEGSPNVFVKKDWLNILDNMNQNYSGNQSVVDTSQLSNSNKYLSYREAFLEVPLLLTLSTSGNSANFLPATVGLGSSQAISLKSWFGNIIHSFTLDYNGTTIIQQTPYINMWNCFKLLTSLSWGDVITQGPSIGFYPDDPLAFVYESAAGPYGIGVCNNADGGVNVQTTAAANVNIPLTLATNLGQTFHSQLGNSAVRKRSEYISYDPIVDANTTSIVSIQGLAGSAYSNLFNASSCVQVWKSNVFRRVDGAVGAIGIVEIAVMATIYLKHIHSFFAMCPLLKGVFMKMTMNLNNTSTNFTVVATANPPAAATIQNALTSITLDSVSNPVGGVNPLMITAGSIYSSSTALGSTSYIATVQVGSNCLNSAVAGIPAYQPGPLAKSIYLYVPAYTFNPVFEQSYLSAPIKQIKYTDVYQYQVINVSAQQQFNNLLTNGISNVKSVLIVPFYSAGAVNTGLGIANPVFQSPFDPAGCGCTSPLSLLGNFNVVVSGQNAIYNTQRYAFEEFNNQLYGQNAVNGGMTDGLTSSLISSLGFEMEYCYYYVNVSRMLPIEESVPKSIQIVGTNYSTKALDLWCFIEYGVDISIDILTGSRV
jgi:hypothetical protein